MSRVLLLALAGLTLLFLPLRAFASDASRSDGRPPLAPTAVPVLWADECSRETSGPSELAKKLEPLCSAIEGSARRLEHRAYVSPKELREIDTRLLGERIARRLYEQCDRKKGETGTENDAEVLMMVPPEVLPLVAKAGFKNQHVTKTSLGTNAQKYRLLNEQYLSALGLPYDHNAKELLPKYGIINVKHGKMGTYDLPLRYGGVTFAFKKSVTRRTTWTRLDSLGLISCAPFEKCSASGQPTSAVYPLHSAYHRKALDGKTPGCDSYCEAQIWGELTLEDVAYAMIPKGVEIPASLAALGLPVYEYETAPNPDQMAQFKLGKLLVAAKPSSVPKQSGLTESDAGTAAKYADPVPSMIEAKSMSGLSTEDLVEKVNALPLPSGSDGFSVDDGVFSKLEPIDQLAAELAARKPTPESIAVFQKLFEKGSPFLRSQALFGLSELPPERLKPLLLKALDDSVSSVRFSAAAIAADFLEDKTIREKLEHLRESESKGALSDFLRRVLQRELCEKGGAF